MSKLFDYAGEPIVEPSTELSRKVYEIAKQFPKIEIWTAKAPKREHG
jgi:hypothetical protein